MKAAPGASMISRGKLTAASGLSQSRTMQSKGEARGSGAAMPSKGGARRPRRAAFGTTAHRGRFALPPTVRFTRRAFTLIEGMVAAGITALLAGMIVAVVSSVSGFWTPTSGKLSTEAQARYILDQ